MQDHIKTLGSCRLCPDMTGPPIIGSVAGSKIMSIGQAPGIHEKKFMKPFSWTAGRTLFKWLAEAGMSEDKFRERVNMSAVCRCFPGKSAGGDRKPSRQEIENCEQYLRYEFEFNRPGLVIPIGRMAIDLFAPDKKYKLDDVIGREFSGEKYGVDFTWIPLPHPSRLNAWNKTPKGRELIGRALKLIAENRTVQNTFFRENS